MQRPDDDSTGPALHPPHATADGASAAPPSVLATAGLITPACVPDDQDLAPQQSPGQYLRRARETRRLSLEHVAAELHLPPAVVDAIECDAYEGLPAPVFVAGYIGAYARLLGLDQDALMEGFRQHHPNAEAPAPQIAAAPAEGGGGWLLGAVSLLIAAALLGGVWLWWDHREGDGALNPFASRVGPPAPTTPTEVVAEEPEPTAAADAQPEPATAAIDATADQHQGWFWERWLRPRPAPPPTETDLDPDATTVAAVPAAAPPPASDAAASADVDADDPAVASADLPELLPQPPLPRPEAPEATDAAPAPAPADPAPIAATDATAGPAAEGPAAQVPPADAAPEVVLSFSGPCWVDIRDASGEVRLSGEMRDGDRHVLDGEPPFSLILGNAAAASVEVGGQPFDVRAIARGNVARFQLDPAEFVATARADPTE